MNPSKSFDAVVIGGGFAGVTAARDLTEQGNAVLLLEARDRLGGRTWSKTFPGTDIAIEMGGTYILSDSPALRREMQRYGVDAHQAIWPESYPTLLNGVHRPGPSPVPFEQVFDLERAGIHMVLAASRITPGMPIDHQGLDDLDVSVAEFFAPLDLPQETYDFVTTVLSLLSFRYPDEGSVLQQLIPLASL